MAPVIERKRVVPDPVPAPEETQEDDASSTTSSSSNSSWESGAPWAEDEEENVQRETEAEQAELLLDEQQLATEAELLADFERFFASVK